MSDAPPNHYETSLETYSVKVAGRWTTVRLEAALMEALKRVALAEGSAVGELCTRVAQERRTGSLTSALRLYVIQHYRDRSTRRVTLARSTGLAREIETARKSLLATEERNYVLRHDLELDQVDAGDTGIALLFAYWKALCHGEDRPPYEAFRLDTLTSVGFDANVHLIDVEPAHPDDFRIIRQAPITMIYRAPDDVPLRALGATLYARELKADYSAAKFKARPVLQDMAVRTSEGALRYQRIILPCATGDGRTGRLVVGVTPLSRLVPRPTSTRA